MAKDFLHYIKKRKCKCVECNSKFKCSKGDIEKVEEGVKIKCPTCDSENVKVLNESSKS